MPSEREKMLAGEVYDSRDSEMSVWFGGADCDTAHPLNATLGRKQEYGAR